MLKLHQVESSTPSIGVAKFCLPEQMKQHLCLSSFNNLELAVNLPKRGNLPGAENLVVQHFLELFAQTKHKEAAELAVESPQGILRTPDTIDKFQACIFVFLGAGISPALVSDFQSLGS
ncbi:hypothetical protein Vadar_019748 [Vaccinium darrowii]|uniref:Uncharacterized protein n=1 Tax=Vaccinium darrowii TaxID=229202 RepID=A0ACB7YNA9_9ERIC|nr:hypothetical protein Vadar_019748 [Vaccinium darrowii]